MTTPFEISDTFTEQWADLDPITATFYGITSRDDKCTDVSPDGHAAKADLYRLTLAAMRPHLGSTDSTQAFAAKVMSSWLGTRISWYENGLWKRDVAHVASTFEHIRDVFDVMGRDDAEDWAKIGARLVGLPGMLEGYRQSLQVGVDEGVTAARRQALALLEQIEAAAGEESRFLALVDQAAEAGVDTTPVADGVAAAREACALLAAWFRDTYVPAAHLEDGVGRELYLQNIDDFLGMELDLDETYEWGWSEVHRLQAEMARTAADIDPSLSLMEVIELLDTDPARSAANREEFVEFISEVQADAISRLDGAHFDVPAELKTVTVNIAPPGGSLGAWYHGPSEDLSRPGSIWYAPGERERLPYWQEVSTAYHEGFPGHHLQVGLAVIQREKLSRFHRMAIWYPGAGEGWALYAERLMDELGYFEKPEYRLGLLVSQLMRATRVVLDIGCHLGLAIPGDAPMHGGERWDFDRAVDYMELVALQPRDMSESEVKRYLGWWAQAISYKVGEREILAIRDDVMARDGSAFDLKQFHRDVLDAGGVRLDQLRAELL